MNVLLDTHTLIWFLEGDNRLSHATRSTIENHDNTNYASIATFWEIAIKTSLGKLETKTSLTNLKFLLFENGIEILPIMIEHTVLVGKLSFYH